MIRNSKQFINDWFVIFILFVSGWKYIYGLEKILDIGLYDESNYLYSGVKLFSNGFPDAESAPLYTIWYYLLSLLQPDIIELYFLNYKILTVLPPILLYILLRKQKVQIIPSVIISSFFLISDANFFVSPKVSHFSLVIIMVFLILAIYMKKSLFNSFAFILVGSLLSTYVRPEFFLTYLIFLFIFTGLLAVSKFKKLQSSEQVAFVAVVLVSGILIISLGLPISGNRSLMAFGQHFSINWIYWNSSGLSPWTNWEDIINQSFGNIHSPMEALFSNPFLFLKHTVFNFITAPNLFVNLFFQHTNLVFSNTLKATEGNILFGLFVLYMFVSSKNWIPKLHDRINTNRHLLVFCSCFLITSFLSVIIIFPRPHYLLIPGVLIIIATASLVIGDDEKQSFHRLSLVIFGLIIFFLTPQVYQGAEANKPNLQTIIFIKSLHIKNEINMLEAEGGYCIYLENKCHRVAEYEKHVSFNDFLMNRKINMIVLSNRLKSDSRFRNDEECKYFLDNYMEFGYVKMNIPDIERELIVKKQLLFP